jgi:hypothetical protein
MSQSPAECSPTIRTLIPGLAEQSRRERAGGTAKPAGSRWSAAKYWMEFN